MVRISQSPIHSRLGMVSIPLALILLGSALSPAPAAAQRKPKAEEEAPVFSDYRGIQIGMTTDDVHKKLGRPKEKDDTRDFFAFGDNESLQVVYDAAHKVATVSVDFLSGAADVPAARKVVGSDVEAKADGSMYKMVRYPKAGYWVSYYRGGGDAPMTSVTMQKIE